MTIRTLTGNALLGAMLLAPVGLSAQTYSEHQHAKAEQERSDARHHTKAKVVGGSAVGGAVVGGLMGGGKGAVIGAGAGAGGGLVANHVRKNRDIKKRERRDRRDREYRYR